MRFAAQNTCLAVLLALLVGLTSVAVHSATHVPGDATQCGFCIAYGDSSDTVEVRHDFGIPPVVDTNVLPLDIVWRATPLTTSIHQRGPPSIH
jgi:hypothetical protein